MVLSPHEPWYVAGCTSAVAIVSKYLFRTRSANIFNPGVKVPVKDQKAIGEIKYDPALPPLPEKARAALDDVVRARAYDRFRLSLIGGPS